MANEIQRLYFGSQASPVAASNLEAGDFTLTFDGQTTSALAYNAADTDHDAALEALSNIGAGDMSVTTETNGFSYEFQNALANTNVAQMTAGSVTLKQKADTVTVNVTQSGVADVNEVQRIDIGGCTTQFDLNGNSTFATISTFTDMAIQTACDTIWGGGNTAVVDLGGGLFRVTFQGTFAAQNITEMTVTNAGDGSPVVTTTTEGVTGQHHIFTITLSNAPTEGTWIVAQSTQLGADLDYNASAADVENRLDSDHAFTVTGSAGGPYTCETDDNYSPPVAYTVSEGATPLRKDCAIEIVTTQEGSAGGATNAGYLLLLGVGA